MEEKLIINLAAEQEDYLRDESRRVGVAESISFPSNAAEIKQILLAIEKNKTHITVQGARTGIAAGAVPQGGHILNLSRMNKIIGMRYDDNLKTFLLTVQPGVLLSKLSEALSAKSFDTTDWSKESKNSLDLFKASGKWFFSPDPTETSASIGGMVACNASGACSFKYGPTRNHVEALTVFLANGEKLKLRRGLNKISGRSLKLQTESGQSFEVKLPIYTMPNVKSAAGYYVKDNMDVIDLFIGSEGTLGIISDIEVKLLPEPNYKLGITAFFPEEIFALEFTKAIRGEERSSTKLEKPVAIEYFNSMALDLLRKQSSVNPAFKRLMQLKMHYNTAIYVEFHINENAMLYEKLIQVGELISNCGGNEEDTWVARNSQDMERLHHFRHSIPEAVNLLIDSRRKKDPVITKLGTDMAVPDKHLEQIVELYNKDLAASGLDSVMFGHIGNNHIHVNILPNSMEEYLQGKNLYSSWATQVISLGGTVSAEHGVGKLKTALLKEMYGEDGISQMKLLKMVFDPDIRLNKGSLFN